MCSTDAWQTGKLKVSTWISDANDASIALHKSVGYVLGAEVVQQFVSH
ncbi:MAG: hypothetical protein IKG22_03260 [Atopobiaceae bacterium]|nr:hypothetical protein [Atopobiaceae bacterium]